MRRVLLALISTVAGLVALLGFKTHAPEAIALGTAPGTTPDTTTRTGTTTTPSTSTAPTKAAATTSTAKKTLTGSAIDTRYGAVQVQITVQGKKILAVTAVQLPDRDGHSAQISQYSAPVLSQEALAAQSASIDMISGATYTSDGYIQSLQSAIDQM